MPRLNRVFTDTVFFLYGLEPKTGKRKGPLGAGVLIGLPGVRGYGYIRHIYAVTCQHVAPQGASIIRINTKNGRSRFIELEPHEWQFQQKGDDLAVVDVTDRLRREDDYSLVPNGLAITKDFMSEVEFGIGEDGFMLGLFANQHGRKRNLVAARFGNISLLANDDEPLRQPNGNRRPSHLFDMRSRPGFSGSPVFVYRTPGGDLRDITYGPRPRLNLASDLPRAQFGAPSYNQFLDDMRTRTNMFLRFFGIHAGQYHDTVNVEKSAHTLRGEMGAPIYEGDKLSIPNSVALVAPAWEVMALLDLPVFQEQRRVRDMADRKKEAKGNPARGEAVESDEAARDLPEADNPRHKGDFNSLVTSVAKKRPRGGRT